jgi:glutaredoxin
VASTRRAAAVTVFVARDCQLCKIATGELRALRDELGFAYEEIEITGVPELERRYREWLPVVEIDGERVFVYRIDEDELRRRIEH